MDEKQFFDRIPQESHPTAGAHVGLGTREWLVTQFKGFSTGRPLGDWETEPDANARGAPQGTLQGGHAGNTFAMPLIYMLNKNYSTHSAGILCPVLLQYVDEGISIVAEKPERGAVVSHPAQGILVDAATYSTGIHHIDIPAVKLQYYTDGEHKSVCLPTKEKRVAHVGYFWATDTPEESQALLADRQTITTDNQAIYLGCTVNISSFGARIPHNLDEIRRDIQQQLELAWPQRRPS